MTGVNVPDGLTPDKEPSLGPLMEVRVDLATGMRVRMDRRIGDVPMLEIVTGRAHLVISVDVGDVRDLRRAGGTVPSSESKR